MIAERTTAIELERRANSQAYALARLLSEQLPALQAADATLWMLSDDDAWLSPLVSARTDASHFEGMRTATRHSRIGMVAATGEAVILGPEDPHNEAVERLTGILTENMVACPVFFRGDLCGVLSCIRSDAGHRFQREDLDRLEWLAFLIEAVLGVPR